MVGAIAVMRAHPLAGEQFRAIVHEVAERRTTHRVREAR
jgi:hypothetical protein